jgi:cytochrome c oxidase subunit 2
MALQVVAEPTAQFEAWAEGQRQSAAQPADEAQAKGKQVFMSSTCVMCHAISGTSASARRAPDLSHLASRRMLGAGALPNKPEQLASWIENPQRHKPGVNMPALQLPPQDMQNLVAYLASLQ